MPTASVFRLWDILLPAAGTATVEPNSRVYLVDLAFGILKTRKDELMACKSAYAVKSCVLCAFGSLYDMSTVIDITMHYHRFLWEMGGGFSSGQIGHLCNLRKEEFKRVNQTTWEQNVVLQELAHNCNLGEIKRTKYKASVPKGVTANEIARQVMPCFKTGLDMSQEKPKEGVPKLMPANWAMHRPMPLVGALLSETTIERTYAMIKEMLNKGEVEMLPSLQGPTLKIYDRESKDPKMKELFPSNPFSEALETPGVTKEQFRKALDMEIPQWTQYAEELWESFTHRRDLVQMEKKEKRYAKEDEARNWSNLFGLMPLLLGEEHLEKMLKINGPASSNPQAISINEFFVSLICCSRGTLGQKASALFEVYSYTKSNFQPLDHVLPASNFAKSISQVDAAKKKAVQCPEKKDEPNHVLHFVVMTNHPRKNTHIGDVFIPKLAEFEGIIEKGGQEQLLPVPPGCHPHAGS
jgi:hypothetical protein